MKVNRILSLIGLVGLPTMFLAMINPGGLGIIASWLSFIGFAITLFVATIRIAIMKFKNNEKISGVLLILLNCYTLGIWGLVWNNKQINLLEKEN